MDGFGLIIALVQRMTELGSEPTFEIYHIDDELTSTDRGNYRALHYVIPVAAVATLLIPRALGDDEIRKKGLP